MSLPWFGFNIKDFVANTLRLNTEAKGAYLMLMLDYYEHESPPPDDDNVLAAITGLSLEAWQRHRPILVTLFVTLNGRWHHERVEREIKEAHEKHDKKVAQTKAATRSREQKRLNRLSENQKTPSTPSHVDRAVDPASNVTSNVTLDETLDVPIIGTLIQTQTQTHIKEVVPNGTTSALGLSSGLGSVIPDEFKLTREAIARCKDEGYPEDEIIDAVIRFKRIKQAEDAISTDWIGSWWNWWAKNRKPLHPSEKPKAKPRVEVSNKRKPFPIPPDWKPNARHGELAAEHGFEIDDIEERFRDSCAAKGYLYLDHDGAFRNFIKNQKSFNRGTVYAKTPARGGSIVDAGLEAIAAIDRQLAEAESRDGGGRALIPVLPEVGLRQPEGGAGEHGDGADGVLVSDCE